MTMINPSTIRDALHTLLIMNGGPIDAEDTVDGVDYVMVRRSDFDRIQELHKSITEEEL
jgi:hypothetical protein